MKKLGLLIISTIILSGCSPKNGIINKVDIEASNYESVKSLLEEQKNVSYIPDDVKEFISKSKDVNDKKFESSNHYLDIRLQSGEYMSDSEFLYEVYMDPESRNDFNSLVDVLDTTISKGIKLYIDKNIDADLSKSGKIMKIGKVWILISPVYEEIVEQYGEQVDEDGKELSQINKNEILLIIQAKDIKDEKYKKITDNIQGEDLILESIKVGKEQNVVSLKNMESKQYNSYTVNKPAINYQLFIKDENINKVRMSIISPIKDEINNDLKSLNRISNQLEFNIDDIKKLEEIKTFIRENKVGKKSVSSENFNFSYKNLETKNFSYQSRNLTEVIIERKK